MDRLKMLGYLRLLVITLIGLTTIYLFILIVFNLELITVELFFAVVGLIVSYYQLRRMSIPEKSVQQRYPGLSVVGIMAKRRAQTMFVATSSLVIGGFGLLLIQYFVMPIPSVFISAFLGLLLAIIGYEALFRFRVRKGLYGRNVEEAREIITFILANADRIDFTDGGRPKPILNERDLEELQERLDQELGRKGARA